MRKRDAALLISGLIVLALPVFAVDDDNMPVKHWPKFFIDTIFRGTKGVILPVCPTAGRESTPTEGRFHYNSNIHAPEFYNGTSWVNIQAGASAGVTLPVNGGTGVTNFLAGTSTTITAGTITVATTHVTANSKIQLTHAAADLTHAGYLSVGTITPGVSFVINSTNGADVDTANYLIVN